MADRVFEVEVIRQFAAETSAEEERRAALSSTEAGRALIRASRTVVAKDREVLTVSDGDVLDAILAIEAEAAAEALRRIREGVAGLPSERVEGGGAIAPDEDDWEYVAVIGRAAILLLIDTEIEA